MYLSAHQKIWCWVVGAINSALFCWIFFDARLYSDAVLQIIYIILSVVGWISWRKNTAETSPTENATSGSIPIEIRVSWLSRQELFMCLGLYILGVSALSIILSYIPSSWIPFFDASQTVASLLATWMITRKKIENWLIWIIVDVLYCVVFCIKAQWWSAALNIVFTAMAVRGFFLWKSDYARFHQGELTEDR